MGAPPRPHQLPPVRGQRQDALHGGCSSERADAPAPFESSVPVRRQDAGRLQGGRRTYTREGGSDRRAGHGESPGRPRIEPWEHPGSPMERPGGARRLAGASGPPPGTAAAAGKVSRSGGCGQCVACGAAQHIRQRPVAGGEPSAGSGRVCRDSLLRPAIFMPPRRPAVPRQNDLGPNIRSSLPTELERLNGGRAAGHSPEWPLAPPAPSAPGFGARPKLDRV